MDHPHNYGSKRSYTEIADVGFDEPVLSNPDASSLSYSQLPTSAIRTLSQPRLAAAATAGDDFPETQLHVPLPLPVEQKLNSICEERDQQQPDADLRRRLGLLGEEKALELLGKIYNSKKIQSLSGYIRFWLRQESPSSASQITPGRQGSTSGGQKQLDSYFSAPPSKSARTSLFQGPSSALPLISPVHIGDTTDNRYYLQCGRALNVNATAKVSNYESNLEKDCRSSTRRKTRPKTSLKIGEAFGTVGRKKQRAAVND
ncbi:hypothetical protein ACFX1X_026649 [Malus domestica]